MEIQEADKRGRVRKIYQSRSTGVANKISELRNTALSLHNLNTAVIIVTSSLVELLGNGVPAGVCYLLTESRV